MLDITFLHFATFQILMIMKSNFSIEFLLSSRRNSKSDSDDIPQIKPDSTDAKPRSYPHQHAVSEFVSESGFIPIIMLLTQIHNIPKTRSIQNSMNSPFKE